MTDQQQPQMDAEQLRQFGQIPVGGSVPGTIGTTYTQEGETVEGPGISGEQIAGMVLGLIFAMLADRRGEHWRLTDSETEQLAKTGGAVMDYYMPEFKGGPWTGFAMCLGVALTPRLLVERTLIAERKEAEARQAAGEGTGGAEGVPGGD